MITTHVPQSWQALQQETARILEECGCSVELEKKIGTARGTVEIDVYAEEIVDGRTYRILCECKYWNSRVPKSVVHGFRSVATDIGANIGYVVSLNGFQSGAYSAAELSNIELVDWKQFLTAFEETWFDKYLSQEILKQLNPLMTYAEPIMPAWYAGLPEKEKDQYDLLQEQYAELGWMLLMFTPYARLGLDKTRPSLPLRNRVPSETTIPAEVLDAVGYREFFEACLLHGLPAISKFRAIRDRNAA